MFFVRMHRARTIRIARVCIRSIRKLRVRMHRMPLLGRRPSQRTRRITYPLRNKEGVTACLSSDFHPSGFYPRALGGLVGAVILLAVEIPYHPTMFWGVMPVHSRWYLTLICYLYWSLTTFITDKHLPRSVAPVVGRRIYECVVPETANPHIEYNAILTVDAHGPRPPCALHLLHYLI
jgi:hypothetical protein